MEIAVTAHIGLSRGVPLIVGPRPVSRNTTCWQISQSRAQPDQQTDSHHVPDSPTAVAAFHSAASQSLLRAKSPKSRDFAQERAPHTAHQPRGDRLRRP